MPRGASGGSFVGRLVARLLAGAWRVAPPPLRSLDERSAIEPAEVLAAAEARVLGGGAGALVWRRLPPSWREETEACPYRDARRFQLLRAAVELPSVAAAVRAAHDAGAADALLVKGWATSRLYPEPGLRPYGDVDLCVRAGERAAVDAALADRARDPALALAAADLHDSLDDLRDRSLDELIARSRVVPLGDDRGTTVRVLGAADALRHAALHLLRHGAWRPLWLCDVALLVERHAGDLDWDVCLRGSREDARRVAFVLGLAHRLLDAELPKDLPRDAAAHARAVPSWLESAALAQWGSPYRRYFGAPIGDARPAGGRDLVRAIRDRWPNGIEASVSVGAPFNALPRLPFQLADVAGRAARALFGGRRV